MTVSLYLLPVVVYAGVAVYMAWCYGKDRTLQFRDLLEILAWPLDVVWPLLLAGVAALELAAVLVAKRWGEAEPGRRATDLV